MLRKLIGFEPIELEIIEPILNKIALAFTAAMVAHFFASLATDTVQFIAFILAGIFIDFVAQFILGLGISKWGQHKLLVGGFLFLAYLVYIIVFAIPSSIVCCVNAFGFEEKVASKQAYVETISKKRLAQIEKEIKILTEKFDSEASSGLGQKSQILLNRIDKLSEEQKSLQRSFEKSSNEVSESSKKSSVKVLETLSAVYKFPVDFIIKVLFSVATGMMYLTLILTSWKIKTKEESEKQKATLQVPESSKKVSEKFEESSEVFETFPEVSNVQKSSPESFEKVPDKEKSSAESLTELKTFIDAAIRPTGTLNSAQKVAAMVGIPVEKCLQYRAYLEGREIDGKPIVRKGRGASAVNFPKDVILRHVGAGTV